MKYLLYAVVCTCAIAAHASQLSLSGNNKFRSLAAEDEQEKFQNLSAEFSYFNRPPVKLQRAKEIFETAINPEKLINQQEKFFGNTLLMDAISKKNVKVAEYLLKQPGLNPDVQNRAKETALILATKRGLATVVQKLIDLGADVAKKDKFGTALYWSQYGPAEIRQMLLKARTPTMIEEMIIQESLSRGITPITEASEEAEEKE